jgi:hypothetical protein
MGFDTHMILETVPVLPSTRQNAHQVINPTSRHYAGALLPTVRVARRGSVGCCACNCMEQSPILFNEAESAKMKHHPFDAKMGCHSHAVHRCSDSSRTQVRVRVDQPVTRYPPIPVRPVRAWRVHTDCRDPVTYGDRWPPQALRLVKPAQFDLVEAGTDDCLGRGVDTVRAVDVPAQRYSQADAGHDGIRR